MLIWLIASSISTLDNNIQLDNKYYIIPSIAASSTTAALKNRTVKSFCQRPMIPREYLIDTETSLDLTGKAEAEDGLTTVLNRQKSCL